MRKSLGVWIALNCVAVVAWAQPHVAWQEYLVQDTAFFNDVVPTPDDGYILVGSERSPSAHTSEMLIVKVDSWGHEVWRRHYSYMSNNVATGIELQSDTTFLVTGFATGESGRYGNGELLQLRMDGTLVQWLTFWVPGDDLTVLNALCRSGDGGWLLAGYTGHYWQGVLIDEDFYFAKLDSFLYTEWTRRYDVSDDDYAYVARATSDGGYIVGGSLLESAGDYLLRLNSQGERIWERSYFIGYYGGVRDVIQLPGTGGFAATGGRFGGGYLLRCATNGQQQWVRTYGSGMGTGILAAGEGFVLTGQFGGDTCMIQTNSAGVAIWAYAAAWAGAATVRDADSAVVVAFNSASYADHFAGGVKFCAPEADASHAVFLQRPLASHPFRLEHDAGVISRFIVTGFSLGSTGRVTGDAAASWSILPQGDGNDGDSIIFEAAVPLNSGSIDTFWIDNSNTCLVDWTAGCRRDTISLYGGRWDSIRFDFVEAPWLDSIAVTIWHSAALESVEVWGAGWNREFEQIAAFEALNGPDDVARYVLSDPYGNHVFYMPVLEDAWGCHRSYPDLEIRRYLGAEDRNTTAVARAFILSAFPNPFNPTTTIALDLPQAGRVRAVVYDLLGREVAVLADQVLSAGTHSFTFDGVGLPSGLYFARVQAGEFNATQKLLLLK